MTTKKKPTADDLTVSERITKAQAKTQKLVSITIDLINLHEANKIIVYAPTLAQQVSQTRAANAFNYFQDAMAKYEIVRLCALFNPCPSTDLDMESVPAVIAMIDHPAVLTMLANSIRDSWATMPSTRVYEQPHEDEATKAMIANAILASNTEFANQQARKAHQRLQNAVKWTKHLDGSPRVKAIRNLRDKHLAHSLERTRLEQRETVARMKWGDEGRLLQKAIALVDALHLGVNNTGMDWSGSVRIARRNAKALWESCTFTPETKPYRT